MEWHQEQMIQSLKSLSSDKRHLAAFLGFVLTDKEFDAIALRVEILKSLTLGHESHRTIAERLHVSVATVTRVANIIKTDPQGAVKIIQKIGLKR